MWLIVPGMSFVFHDTVLNNWDASITQTVGSMSAEEIFKYYGKSIGIGGIAMAGIIGVIKSWSIIKNAIVLASKELRGGSASAEKSEAIRTQRDISFRIIAIGSLITLLVIFLFFWFGVMNTLFYAVVGVLLVAIIAFLFTTVAANAIAIVGSNPVSGNDLNDLDSCIRGSCCSRIERSKWYGCSPNYGWSGLYSLVYGRCICYRFEDRLLDWNNSTEATNMEILGYFGVGSNRWRCNDVINSTYGFASGQLAAPQANAMAAVIDPLMNGAGAPWLLYGIGALIAIVLTWCRVPALAFALGMFIPLELNLPLVVGGAVNWYVTSRSSDAKVNEERGERVLLLQVDLLLVVL